MKSKFLFILFALISLYFPQIVHPCDGTDKIPDNFVDIQKVIPGVLMDIRYYGPHNFVGEKVDGYLAPKCYLTKEAAQALAGVQQDLELYSLTLKIYDCYRPQRAVNHFVHWAKEIENTRQLFECYLPAEKRFSDNSLDMGTGFDCFHELSHTANPGINRQQKNNRLLLKSLMEKHGFKNYDKEWWHYTLKNEPYPNTYFDFVIE
jgi:D-alanyl-D-alanine dipeptidase